MHADGGEYTRVGGTRIVVTLWASPTAKASLRLFKKCSQAETNPAFLEITLGSGRYGAGMIILRCCSPYVLCI